MADGITTTAGMWFKKKSVIGSEFSSTVSSGVTNCTPTALTVALASSQHLSTDYFFLPAVGYTHGADGAFGGGGSYGYYWSSTPYSNTSGAYGLGFYSTGADLNYTSRPCGFCLWGGQ